MLRLAPLELALVTLTVSLWLHPALASAQDAPSSDYASLDARAGAPETATHYDVESTERRPSRGWPRPELQGWRRDAEYGLRLRLGIERRAVAAENARRDRERGGFGTGGTALIAMGAVFLGGGVVAELVALVIAIGSAGSGGSGNGAAVAAIGGGVSGCVGVLGLIVGGSLLSQRPRHLQPGEVTLTLGPGSLAVTF